MFTRITLGTIFAAAALAGGTVALSPVAHADTTPGVTRVLIVGDSVTQGKVGDYTWRYRLWNTLRANKLAVDFVGPHDGLYDSTSATPYDNPGYVDPGFDQDHAARWGAAMAAFTDIDGQTPAELVGTYAPDVVINDLGINDLTWFGETPAQLLDRMSAFVTAVRSSAPHATIIFGELTQVSRAGVTEYNADIETLAASLDQPDARVLTATAAGYDQDADTYDGTHPNASGEVKLAAQFSDVLLGLGLPTDPVPPAPATYSGAAQLVTTTTRAGRARLTFTTPAGATRQAVWMRDVTRGAHWRLVAYVGPSTHRYRTGVLRHHHRYAFRLRAYQGTVASSAWSNRVAARVG